MVKPCRPGLSEKLAAAGASHERTTNLRISGVYWILAAIFLLIAFAVPKLRPVGIFGSVLLGLMLGWGMVQRLRNEPPDTASVRGSPSSPTSAVRAFPLEMLDAKGLRIAGNGAPFEVRGHVTNRSTDMRVRSFTVMISRRDCFDGSLDPSGCSVLWESRQWIELSLPPGESRDFASSFWTRGDVPRARGRIQDTIDVVAADGEPASQVEEETPGA
jgi:hypothetical protein